MLKKSQISWVGWLLSSSGATATMICSWTDALSVSKFWKHTRLTTWKSWSWHVCWDDVVKCNLLENSWDYFKRELVDGRVLDGRAHRQLDHVLQTHKKNSDETRSRKITRKSEERNICSDSLGRSIELYSRATGNYSYSAWLVQSRHEMAPLILSLRLKSLTSNYSDFQSLTLLLSVTARVTSNDDKTTNNERTNGGRWYSKYFEVEHKEIVTTLLQTNSLQLPGLLLATTEKKLTFIATTYHGTASHWWQAIFHALELGKTDIT